MAHSRILIPVEFATGDSLTGDMVAIGMRFAAKPSSIEPNIEDTLVAASIEGVVREDYRALSLLVDWLGIHSARINADRLFRMVQLLDDRRLKAFWAAIAQWQVRDWRFKKIQKVYRGPQLDLMGEGTEFQIKKNGEDERFAGSALRVPAKLLRHRPDDILLPKELAKRHRAYFFRIMIGPSYRADMWAATERSPGLAPAEIARIAYGSFPTAWEARRDWMLLFGGNGNSKQVKELVPSPSRASRS